MNSGLTAGAATAPAQIDKNQMHLWLPAVDGILRRFNDEATRPEAALSAVYMLQAMKAIGVFDLNAPITQRQPVYEQPAPGQRPAVRNDDLVRKLEDELSKKQPDNFTRT